METGPLTTGVARQDELKAETLAESFRRAGVNILALAEADYRLGPGVLASVDRLSGARLLGGRAVEGVEVLRSRAQGPWIFVWDGQGSVDDGAVEREVRFQIEAEADVILVTEGDEARGIAWAETFAAEGKALAAVVYRGTGNPSPTARRVGGTVIVSPGPQGRHVLRLNWNGARFVGYEAIALGPEVGDDEEAARFYRRYQGRLKSERLLEAIPRRVTAAFAGSQACASCHGREYEIWQKSRHADALATLERIGSDWDPDCVSCHVVGLESTKGFQAREKTPHLTDVGCESCHGPGAQHVKKPAEAPMPKIGKASCLGCHVPGHSPGFDFESYWKKIEH